MFNILRVTITLPKLISVNVSLQTRLRALFTIHVEPTLCTHHYNRTQCKTNDVNNKVD